MSRTNDADAEAIAALLESIQQLRLTLAMDLSVAAGAIEANEPTIARDIIAADRCELQRLTDRPAIPRQSDRSRRRRRRALLALPAIPLVGALAMTGAAAINGDLVVHHRPHRATVHQSATERARSARNTTAAIDTSSPTASTTLRQLALAVHDSRRQSQVAQVADHLHHQLSAIIATSSGRPQRLLEVKQMLATEQALLKGQTGAAAVTALAASQRLTDLLTVNGLPTVLPTSPVTLLAPLLPSPSPTIGKPTKHSPSPTPSSSSSSRPSPSPTPTHHHHRHLTDPLLGTGLFGTGL